MRANFLQHAVRVSICALILSGLGNALSRSSAIASTDAAETGGDMSGGDSTFDNIEIVDASLVGKIGITRVGSQPSDNGLLSVFAGFKNKTERKLNLEVETVYKDSSGNSLNTASWIPMTLKPHEEMGYRSSSITDQANDFLIRIRIDRK
jgi:hypothetical protein